MSRRRYSDDDRAAALAALAANGGNLGRTARQLGIPRATLQCWQHGSRHPEAAEHAAPKKAELADKLEAIAHQLIDAIPGKIGAAPLAACATAAGIAIDKARLLRGQPTAINDNSHRFDDLSDEELDAELAELERAPGAVAAPEASQGSAD